MENTSMNSIEMNTIKLYITSLTYRYYIIAIVVSHCTIMISNYRI